MDHSNIREPKQKRSIEKKKKIVRAGYQLFSEKGYHKTNTVEIAKRAGVSTGTVYSYFADKKAIFLAVIRQNAEDIVMPMYRLFDQLSPPFDLYEILEKIIDITVQSHQMAKSSHEEMLAMSHQDEDVGKFMIEFEEKYILKFAEIMDVIGLRLSNPNEKVHIIFNIMQFYCHEVVYHRHSFIDYDVMKKQVLQMMVRMIAEDFTGDQIVKEC